MIKKFLEFTTINESGIRNITNSIKGYTEAEIYFHQDLDGVTSFLCMKSYLESYGIKVIDAHIIQYGGIEFAVKSTKPGVMPVLVDFANNKDYYVVATDHHDRQVGAEKVPSTHFKASRSNAETISGEIAKSDVFTSTDIELIQTVDSANFYKYNITPEDIQNAIFSLKKDLSGEKNRFLLGFVVNRLILALKNKRIEVLSFDGKRKYSNKNILECLALDSSPSIYSMYNVLKYYIKNAVSLEWDRMEKSHNSRKRLITPEEINKNLEKYISKRKSSNEVRMDKKYKILYQYGIGEVFDTGSYDRYVVFKNNPEGNFLCVVYEMGLIQVSCNPFKEKVLKKVNLGEITKKIINKLKDKLSQIYIPISDLKMKNESEIKRNKNKYGNDYEGIGYTFNDLQSFYGENIVYYPNRIKNGDINTINPLDISENNPSVNNYLKALFNKPFSEWKSEEKDRVKWLRISFLDIILKSSGGHPSITNISGLDMIDFRKDLLKSLFGFDTLKEFLQLIASDFIKELRKDIDLVVKGEDIEKSDLELKGGLTLENKNRK